MSHVQETIEGRVRYFWISIGLLSFHLPYPSTISTTRPHPPTSSLSFSATAGRTTAIRHLPAGVWRKFAVHGPRVRIGKGRCPCDAA